MSEAPAVTLRPLGQADLPLMARWLAAAHLRPFYVAGAAPDAAAVAVQYRAACGEGGPVHGVIASACGAPFGYLQWYRNRAFPTYGIAALGRPEGVSVDYFVGEAAALGRGLGRAMLTAGAAWAVGRVGSADRAVFVAHHPSNRAAIRCSRAAGFVPDGRFVEDGEARARFVSEPSPCAPHLEGRPS